MVWDTPDRSARTYYPDFKIACQALVCRPPKDEPRICGSARVVVRHEYGDTLLVCMACGHSVALSGDN